MRPQELMPSLSNIDRRSTIKYIRKLFRGVISGKISRNLPPDALSAYFGAKHGGDNHDLRAKLLVSHFFTLQQTLKLGTQIGDSYYVYRSNEAQYELGQLVHDYPYTVLVYVGIYPDHDAEFQSEFEHFKKHIPSAFNRFLITNQYDPKTFDNDDDVLGDYDAKEHIKLDIPLSMIYVIDAEKTIVWRSMWKEREKALLYIQSYKDKK